MSQWEYVEQVPREIRKAGLDKRERVTVDKALSRVAAGQTLPRDVKHLRGEISEVRITANRRELRLLFARIDHGLVLLGLCFFQKQSRTTPKDLIDLAESRLGKWRANYP